jgi:hypothetical protein
LLSFSPLKADIKIEVDPDRLRPIDADLQIPNTAKFEAPPAGSRRFRTTRRCAIFWTIGASASPPKEIAS